MNTPIQGTAADIIKIDSRNLSGLHPGDLHPIPLFHISSPKKTLFRIRKETLPRFHSIGSSGFRRSAGGKGFTQRRRRTRY